MNLPVKRVENRTGDQKYWSYSVDNNKDTLKHGSATGTGHNDTHIPIWRCYYRWFSCCCWVTTIPTFPYGVDRRKISTFLAGVIPDKFAVRF